MDFRVVGALKTPVAELWDDDQPDEDLTIRNTGDSRLNFGTLV